MTVEAPFSRRVERLSAEERKHLARISTTVGQAARWLLRRGHTTLSRTDLEAQGMLAVWRRLPEYDPARASFDEWVFYQAKHAMQAGSRAEGKETTFAGDLRTGARGVAAQDERGPEMDIAHDTPETDRRRVSARARTLAVAAWLEAHTARARAAVSAEEGLETAEDVRALWKDIEGLGEQAQQYIHLRFWEDVEVQELALRLGIPERTLRRRWAETRERVARALERRGVFGIPERFGEAAAALGGGKGPPR